MICVGVLGMGSYSEADRSNYISEQYEVRGSVSARASFQLQPIGTSLTSRWAIYISSGLLQGRCKIGSCQNVGSISLLKMFTRTIILQPNIAVWIYCLIAPTIFVSFTFQKYKEWM